MATTELSRSATRTEQGLTTAQLVQRATEQISTLLKDELALARAEMAEKGKQAGVGVGMFTGSGLIALYGLAVLFAAAVLGLAVVFPAWLSALIVAAGLFLVAGVMALVGRARLRRVGSAVPEQAMTSVRADVDEIMERTNR